MDCRETQALLTAFHDGEATSADRARVEEHLRGCPECSVRLADLARVDRAAGVPDPGPAYWDRFNARVMERVEREADGPKVAVLRPKGGWMRQQLRYLLPAAAAAALVMMVVRFGGMNPGAPTPTVPPAVSEPAAPDSAKDRSAKAESAVAARPVPPPVPAKERFSAVTREERDRPADRSLPAGNEKASRDRAAAPAVASAPSPPMAYRSAPVDSPPVPAADEATRGMQAERKKLEGAAARMAERQDATKATSAGGMRMANDRSASPCESARTLAGQERFREAEAAQRACLAQDRSAPAQEKGLVFLAELLDRQARFDEADTVIAEVDRQYPQSRPLDLYLQRRPMVQKEPMTAPLTR